jgi:hypothetical protein
MVPGKEPSMKTAILGVIVGLLFVTALRAAPTSQPASKPVKAYLTEASQKPSPLTIAEAAALMADAKTVGTDAAMLKVTHAQTVFLEDKATLTINTTKSRPVDMNRAFTISSAGSVAGAAASTWARELSVAANKMGHKVSPLVGKPEAVITVEVHVDNVPVLRKTGPVVDVLLK